MTGSLSHYIIQQGMSSQRRSRAATVACTRTFTRATHGNGAQQSYQHSHKGRGSPQVHLTSLHRVRTCHQCRWHCHGYLYSLRTIIRVHAAAPIDHRVSGSLSQEQHHCNLEASLCVNELDHVVGHAAAWLCKGGTFVRTLYERRICEHTCIIAGFSAREKVLEVSS
jgi:hypothetical protein